ncbi:MAG: DUF3551 domain-containing protein [Xanthobacteraceae bacterium]|nr:DUF3551 domain-containing protein [Xanthobacteraceae bacterium]
MRKFMILGLLAAALAVPTGAEAAYRGGWCLVANLGIGSVSERCSFRTFEACQAYARGYGPSSFCRVSGYPIGGESRPAKKRSKYRY